jgi:hypothetical protein
LQLKPTQTGSPVATAASAAWLVCSRSRIISSAITSTPDSAKTSACSR